MNALALYSLTQLPNRQEPVSAKRPAKRIKVQELIPNSVKYICSKCHSPIYLTTTDVVQCTNCDNRIVHKVTSGVTKTYNAV